MMAHWSCVETPGCTGVNGNHTEKYMTRIAPSAKNLIETFRFTPEQAKQIRKAWKHEWNDDLHTELQKIIETVHQLHHGFIETRTLGRQMAIDVLGEFHGIEYLGQNRDGYEVEYLNSGDTYAPTLIFVGDRMFISTMGDLVESGYIKNTGSPY
jgi:hypothetical protein